MNDGAQTKRIVANAIAGNGVFRRTCGDSTFHFGGISWYSPAATFSAHLNLNLYDYLIYWKHFKIDDTSFEASMSKIFDFVKKAEAIGRSVPATKKTNLLPTVLRGAPDSGRNRCKLKHRSSFSSPIKNVKKRALPQGANILAHHIK